jgi:hypothetical protein
MGEAYTVIVSFHHLGKVGIFKGINPSRKVSLFFEDKGKMYPFNPTSAIPLDPHLHAAKKEAKPASGMRAPASIKREAPTRIPRSPTKTPSEPIGLSLC